VRISLPRKIGILDPELTFLGEGADADQITLKLPSRTVRIGVDQFQEISSILPHDGNPVSATYHQALPLNDNNPKIREYIDSATQLQTPHYFTGLENFSADNRNFHNNTINLDLRFRPAIGNLVTEDFASWEIIDPVTGATFIGRLEAQNDEASQIDLSDYLFHSSMVKARITTYHETGEEYLDYHFLNDTPNGTVQQKVIAQSNNEILLKLSITGDRAKELSQGFQIFVASDTGDPLCYVTQPSKLGFGYIAETLPVVDFQMAIPLDFVDSRMNIVRLVTQSQPATVLTTSLRLSALRPYLPSTLQAAHSDVEMEVLSDKEVVVRSSNAGLLMVDTTEDFKVWRRALTTMIDSNAPYKFAMPPSSSNKLFLRDRMMKAQ